MTGKIQDKSIRQRFTKKKYGEFLAKDNKNPDAIIIGSGVSGLVNATLLARAGWKVLVLEQHDVAGGTTHQFTEKNQFEFDTGLHYVGDMLARSKVMDALCGGKVQWAELDTNYDICCLDHEDALTNPDKHLIHCKGYRKISAKFKKQFPKEAAGIDKYFKAAFRARMAVGPMAARKVLPGFVRPIIDNLLMGDYEKYSSTSTYDIMKNECGLSDELIGKLTYNWGDFGTIPTKSPFMVQALHVTHWMKGSYYPVGGPENIAIAMIEQIEKYGGKVFVQAFVDEILINEETGRTEGVRMKKGDGNIDLKSKMVISSAGSYNTYIKLLNGETIKSLQEKDKIPQQVLDIRTNILNQKLKLGTSIASLFIGIQGKKEDLNLPSNNMWIFPSWDFEKNMAVSKEKGLIDGPLQGCFIAFPSSKDPTWTNRWPDVCVCEVLTLVSYDEFAKFEGTRIHSRGQEYDELKEKLTLKMLDVFYQKFPQLKGKVVYQDLGTPLTNNFYLNSHKGEVYALDHDMSRFSIEQQKLLTPDTGIPGLYVTGQDIFLAGIAGALAGGATTTAAISYTALLKNWDIAFRSVPLVWGEKRKPNNNMLIVGAILVLIISMFMFYFR